VLFLVTLALNVLALHIVRKYRERCDKPGHTGQTQAIVERSLRHRYWAERRFRMYGFAAVTAGMAFWSTCFS
jgi:hypothetical protein